MGLPRRQHVWVNTWVSAHKLECHKGKCGAAGGWEVKLCVPVYDITPVCVQIPWICSQNYFGKQRTRTRACNSKIYHRRNGPSFRNISKKISFFTRRRGCYYFRAVSRALPKTRWSLPSILKPGRSKTALFCWEPPKEDLFSTSQKNVVNLSVPP